MPSSEMVQAEIVVEPIEPTRSPPQGLLAEATTRSISAATSDRGDEWAALSRGYLDLRRRVVDAARGQVAALGRLGAYRRANEELQNCFFGVEQRLSQRAAGLDLSFADEPARGDFLMALRSARNGVAQVLPASCNGLSAIEIHFAQVVAKPGATLRVHLTGDDQGVVARWTVPLERLGAGWTMFALDSVVVDSGRLLQVRLDLEAAEDADLVASLGALRMPVPFQAHDALAAASVAGRGLALRLWCGDAPTASSASNAVIIADHVPVDLGRSRVAPLAPALLAQTSWANTGEGYFEFAPVISLPYLAAVGVHPPSRGMTIADVPLPRGSLVRGAAAEIVVANELAREVEFAVVVAADLARARGLLDGEAPAAHEAVSGWTTVSYGTPGAIAAALKGNPREGSRLFFATRMQTPGVNHYAWARFRNVLVGLGR